MPCIAKRPPKKTWFYKSRDYKRELMKKFKKNPKKSTMMYFMHYTTDFNPYALDWFDKQRTKVMQCRANAMLDAQRYVLQQISSANLGYHDDAKKAALLAYARRQHQEDGRNYCVVRGSRGWELGNLVF